MDFFAVSRGRERERQRCEAKKKRRKRKEKRAAKVCSMHGARREREARVVAYIADWQGGP